MAGLPAADFDHLYGSVLRQLAAYVDLLPASAAGTHQGAGGLFRLALEIAFFSRQASEAVVFAARDGVERRRILEPRWRYATWLAGLCCELHRPLSRMVVVTDRGEEWPMHRGALSEWLRERAAARYFIQWVDGEQQFVAGSASVLAARIIPDHAMQYLQEGHSKIIPAMLEAVVINPAQNATNPVAEVVYRMRQKVFDRDAVLAPQNYGRLTVGSHLEPHLLDAMRQLVRDKVWTVNIKKARLWYGRDGLFIVWRTAAKEMREVLERNQVSGIPQDGTTLAEALHKAGVFVADSTGNLYWQIKTPLSESELTVVRLSAAEKLLVALEDDDQPKRLDVDLVVKDAPPAAVALSTDSPASPPQARTESATKPMPAVPAAAPAIDPATGGPPSTEGAVPGGEAPAAPPTASDGADVSLKDTPQSADKRSPQDRKRPPSGGQGSGAIVPVDEATPAELPEDIANQMSPVVRAVMGQLVADARAGKLTESSAKHPEGLAIAMEQVAAYGVEVNKIMLELSNLGWLYKSTENPNRKIHPATINGRAIPSAIIKTQVAMDLGLKV